MRKAHFHPSLYGKGHPRTSARLLYRAPRNDCGFQGEQNKANRKYILMEIRSPLQQGRACKEESCSHSEALVQWCPKRYCYMILEEEAENAISGSKGPDR